MATATPLKILAGLITQFQTGDSLPVVLGGTGANDAPTALTNLGAAPLASPAFTGNPTAPTQTAANNSTRIATTAYADGAIATETTRAEAAEAAEVTRAEAAEALLAPLASPALTGNPTAPTQTAADNSTRVATTAYADGAIATEKTRALAAETLLAPKASPALTGTPTAPTATALTNSTQVATTAYSDAAVAVEKTRALAAEALLAPKASPALTGIPTAPTASALTNSTQVATTAYADAAVAVEKTRALAAEALLATDSLVVHLAGTETISGAKTFSSTAAFANIVTSGALEYRNGVNNRWISAPNGAETGGNAGSDWSLEGFSDSGTPLGFCFIITRATGNVTSTGTVTATGFIGSGASLTGIPESGVTNLTTDLAAKAPLASPALTGTPTAPTAGTLTNSTQVATTAYADAAVAVEKTRALAAETLLAPLASPALTGNPTAPTQGTLNNSTRVATTAYADAAVAVEKTRALAAETLLATDSLVVHLAGIETVTGAKTFSTLPVLGTLSGLVRAASGVLSAGTAGTADLGVASPGMCQGRLTLTSGTAVTTTDVTAATTLYFTPYGGALIGLYSGTAWVMVQFTETTISLSGLAANTNYDIFAYNNAGVIAFDAPVAWTNGTTRATALVLQNGVWCKSGTLTRRYIGTIRTTATTGQCEDSMLNRFVWNLANPVERLLQVTDATASWTYSTATWRPGDNNTANRVNVVIGLQVSFVRLTLAVIVSAPSGAAGMIGIGEDSTTAPHAYSQGDYGLYNATGYQTIRATLEYYPAAGVHYYQWLEFAQTGTPTYYSNQITGLNSGITGVVRG